MYLLACLLSHTLSLPHRANRCRVYCVSGGFTFVITNIIIFVGLLVVLQVRIPSSKLNTYNSAPEDTHIISYFSTFCNGVTASDTADTEGEASFYLLKSKPPLSGLVNNLKASPPATIEATLTTTLNSTSTLAPNWT